MNIYRKAETKKTFTLSTTDIHVQVNEDNTIWIQFNAGGGRGVTNFALEIPPADMPEFIRIMSLCLYEECARPARDLTVPELLDILKKKMGYEDENIKNTEE